MKTRSTSCGSRQPVWGRTGSWMSSAIAKGFLTFARTAGRRFSVDAWPSRRPRRRQTMSPRFLLTSSVVLVLMANVSGCVRYYWFRPGTTMEQFNEDSVECAREASLTAEARQRGVVIEEIYRACLTARGYTRDKKFEPPPTGWYRGIE